MSVPVMSGCAVTERQPGAAGPLPAAHAAGPHDVHHPSGSTPDCPPGTGHLHAHALVAHAHAPGPNGYAPGPAFIPNPQGIDRNEFLCDGGDAPPAAKPRAGDQIIGVGLEDTVARYRTERGEVNIAQSNPVCVYAPRFKAVRRVTGTELGELAVGPQRALQHDGPIRIEMEQPGLAVTGRDALVHSERTRGPDAMRARDRGVPVENVLQPVLAEDALALLSGMSIVTRGTLQENERALIERHALAATVWSVDLEVAAVVAGEAAAAVTRDKAARELVIYDLPEDGRLRVVKLADRSDALPGEIVSFILRIDNVGDSPLHDIVLTDSLTTRLQYVPESQTSSRDAAFAAEENEGQSLRLTWKFSGELKVGEGATVEFKCRVR